MLSAVLVFVIAATIIWLAISAFNLGNVCFVNENMLVAIIMWGIGISLCVWLIDFSYTEYRMLNPIQVEASVESAVDE